MLQIVDMMYSYTDYNTVLEDVNLDFEKGKLDVYKRQRQCVSYIKEQMGQRKYKYTMTTNGTLLTPATVEFLSDNNFSIFISLDGPKEEHDVNRKFRTGKGSFDTIMKNISHIKEHNYEFWKNLGFMITLNPKVDLKKVTEFFDHTDICLLYTSGWKSLSAKETGRIGGLMTRRKKKTENM